MIVVAVASGTSADACDVAAVDVEWDRDTIAMRVLGTTESALPDGLSARVLAILPPARLGIEDVGRLDTDLGHAFADAATVGIRDLAGGVADLIVSPGQTAFHDVVGGECRGTLQLGQPAWVAARTGLPVVSDLRASDVASGGHGAPLASTFDALWLAGIADSAPVAALNLGGIANVSVVGAGGNLLASFDTGPANCLLDIAAAQVSGGAQTSDVDGTLALAGRVDEAFLDRLLADEYFALAPPKSTGRELFSADFLAAARAGIDISGEDLLASLTEFTARTIGDALRAYGVGEVVVSGGGLRNPALMQAIGRQVAPAPLVRAEERGIDGDAKEALLWALLGFLTWHGVPGTVRAGDRVSTGATEPRVLGRITPGAAALELPAPRNSGPRALVVR
ncbi:anhydro-N-acetylmuramic acid kinase [Solicola gregarius]|uniref:Anhydro-N-acetylmuramic acid kinase n=1 Tax=Solicola gregarius TaxID=2908642 RepID=A0AA46TDU6_9ACTN|nr:anhydro-N-acetylmuramic acid kinase [Solicola gregarius]UYM03466.1 anhydro-N-acetylmuramic acid kinase [Solicola gregarius]